MARRLAPSDITHLLPWVNLPYRIDEVIAAAKDLQPPFLLREVAEAADLPLPVVQRVLSRLVKQGRATRFKARMSYPHWAGRGQVYRPGGKIRNVWAYTLVEPK